MTQVYRDLAKQFYGPVYPIVPAFDSQFRLDTKAVARYVDYLCEHKVRAVMVTAGTSRFTTLNNAEIAELNRIVVAAAKGRTKTIIANPMVGTTSEAIEFAKLGDEIGADALLVYFPDRFYSTEQIVDYFRAIGAESKLGLMIHAMPMRTGAATGSPWTNWDAGLCGKIADAVPSLIGMKEENGVEDVRYKLAVHLADRMSIIVAGSSMRMFMGCCHFGARGYLTGIGSFFPEREETFWKLYEKSDWAGALKIVTDEEEPFFDLAKQMGWHIAMRGTLALQGFMERYERPPVPAATDAQLDQLRAFGKKLGWKLG